MVKLITSISLSEELIHSIDKSRGLIPRSSYIEFLLVDFLNKSKGEQQDEA